MNLPDLFWLFPSIADTLMGICCFIYGALQGFVTGFMPFEQVAPTLDLMAELWERLFC